MSEQDDRIVLVTGANGFVGPAHLHPRWRARDGSSVARSGVLPRATDEVLIQSIGPTNDWQAALAGVHAVVQPCRPCPSPRRRTCARRSNRDAISRHLASCPDATADAGVATFIFLSTVLVHGRSNDGRPLFRETDSLKPRGLYGMSKAAAEHGLKALAQNSDMSVTVIRPPLVYGAGAKGNFVAAGTGR